MTNQFTVDKANALNRINQATNFRKSVLDEYTGVVDWDDPESWKKGGAIHRAIAEQHAAKFRTGRGTGTQKGLEALKPESFEEQMREAVIADGTLETLRRKYNKHKGYLGQTTTGVEAQYESLIKNATKQIMNPQNTSTLRKLLGKVGLAKDLNADLTDIKLGTGRTIKLDENTIKQYTSDFGRKTSEAVKLEEEVAVEKENTGKSRDQILANILRVDKIKIDTKSLKDVSPEGDSTVNLLLYGDATTSEKQRNNINNYLSELDFVVPINEEAKGPTITIAEAFNKFSISERANFIAGVKENVKNNVLAQQEVIKNLPGDPVRGITAEVTVTQEILNDAINQTISQRVTFATDATGKAIVGEERRFRFDVAADHTVLSELEYRVKVAKELKAAGETPPPTITGDEEEEEDPTTTKLDFNKAVSGFRQAIKKDEWTDKNGNVVPKDVDSLFDRLQSDYGDDPAQRESLRSIYNEYKESIKTPFPKEKRDDYNISQEEALTRLKKGELFGIGAAAGRQKDKQALTKLKRYAETGKKPFLLEDALERSGLPSDASPEEVLAFLEKDKGSLLAKR